VPLVPFTPLEAEAVGQIMAATGGGGERPASGSRTAANLHEALEADADAGGDAGGAEELLTPPPRATKEDGRQAPVRPSAGATIGGGAGFVTSPYHASRAAASSSVARSAKDKADANALKKGAMRIVNREAQAMRLTRAAIKKKLGLTFTDPSMDNLPHETVIMAAKAIEEQMVMVAAIKAGVAAMGARGGRWVPAALGNMAEGVVDRFGARLVARGAIDLSDLTAFERAY
jgi:hypothetical protein